MILSTRGRYGLKAVYELATYYGKGPIPLKEIARNQNLSESYLEQLFLSLRRDGIIKSVRGAQGGYMLSNKPEKITVGRVLRCLEGSLSPSACVSEDEDIDCSKEEECITKFVWLEIKKSIDEVIDSITLKDMIDKEESF